MYFIRLFWYISTILSRCKLPAITTSFLFKSASLSSLKANGLHCVCLCFFPSLWMDKKSNFDLSVSKCHFRPVCLPLLTVCFTMISVCMSDKVKSKTFYTDVNIQTLVFPQNHELNTLLMSHTSLSTSIATYHSLVFLMSLFIHSLLSFSTSISQCPFLPPSISPSPPPPHPSLFFFLRLNNWWETFCLLSAGWGGLKDMTRLWRALCTTLDMHTHEHTHWQAHIWLQSSSKGHFCCINVAGEKVLGVHVLRIYWDPHKLTPNRVTGCECGKTSLEQTSNTAKGTGSLARFTVTFCDLFFLGCPVNKECLLAYCRWDSFSVQLLLPVVTSPFLVKQTQNIKIKTSLPVRSRRFNSSRKYSRGATPQRLMHAIFSVFILFTFIEYCTLPFLVPAASDKYMFSLLQKLFWRALVSCF